MENEPPSSGSEEGTTHPSLRRYTHPMILCFTNTSLIPAPGDSLNDGIAHSPNQRPPPQLPDYPFLSAARFRTCPKDASSDTAHSGYHPTHRRLRGFMNHGLMGGAAGYQKDGIKERWEASKAHQGALSAGVESEWRRVSRTGQSAGNEDSNEDIRLFHITPRITGYYSASSSSYIFLNPNSRQISRCKRPHLASPQDGIREQWEALKAGLSPES
ncbi:hypothetical protein F5887DRAFT_1160169 [Amanita rubescens]|nr:hypothetical protein F5887DRAFT_1160169 [Amanita rubescens]